MMDAKQRFGQNVLIIFKCIAVSFCRDVLEQIQEWDITQIGKHA